MKIFFSFQVEREIKGELNPNHHERYLISVTIDWNYLPKRLRPAVNDFTFIIETVVMIIVNPYYHIVW